MMLKFSQTSLVGVPSSWPFLQAHCFRPRAPPQPRGLPCFLAQEDRPDFFCTCSALTLELVFLQRVLVLPSGK